MILLQLAQLGEAYAQDYDLQLDTEAIYRKTWRDLVLGQFKDRVMLDTDNVVHLSPKEVSRQNFGSKPIAQLAQRAVIATQRAPAPAPAPPVVSPPVTAAHPMSVRTPSAPAPSTATLTASTTQPTVMTENIRRLFQVASQSSPQGLPISTVSALIGCPEPDALRIAVVQYSQFFQIKFVEGALGAKGACRLLEACCENSPSLRCRHVLHRRETERRAAAAANGRAASCGRPHPHRLRAAASVRRLRSQSAHRGRRPQRAIDGRKCC
jgi:hypothetical protein